MEAAYKKINAANKDMTFDFAKEEYIRLVGIEPSQAVPFLKIMAMKAKEKSEWRFFESLILCSISC